MSLEWQVGIGGSLYPVRRMQMRIPFTWIYHFLIVYDVCFISLYMFILVYTFFLFHLKVTNILTFHLLILHVPPKNKFPI